MPTTPMKKQPMHLDELTLLDDISQLERKIRSELGRFGYILRKPSVRSIGWSHWGRYEIIDNRTNQRVAGNLDDNTGIAITDVAKFTIYLLRQRDAKGTSCLDPVTSLTYCTHTHVG